MKNTTTAILNTLFERHTLLLPIKTDIMAGFKMLLETYQFGGKLLVCGNGGSAADAEHIVGELLNKFKMERPLNPRVQAALPEELAKKLVGSLPAICLSSMTGALTAIGNDIDWECVFAQQAMGLAQPGDVLWVLSTSGNSANCVAAAEVVKAKGGRVLAFTGAKDSKLSEVSHITIKVPETETYRIQEAHLPIYHAFCAALESELF